MNLSTWKRLMTGTRVLAAGALAFFIGVPLTEKAFGQVGDIVWGSIDLTLGLLEASDGS